jgi:HK97 family phage prohead protease
MPRIETKESGVRHEVRAFSFEVRATSEDGTVEGYGSVFGVKDAYEDVIAVGAFVDSLKAHKAAGTMPAMLWQHDSDEPCGVWDEMAEDAKGLKVKGRLAMETVKGREAYSLLKMGALSGLSIGFVSQEWSYDRETEIRTLIKIDLWEVSLVTFPANGKARVTGVKAIDVTEVSTIRQAEKALRDAGFSNDAACAFIAQVKRMALDERDARDATERFNRAAEKLLTSLKS